MMPLPTHAPGRKPKGELKLTPEIFERALSHPAYFISDLLQAELWRMQIEICNSVAQPSSDTACKGCHACSKTFTAGGIVCWWTLSGDDHIAVTTAPTAEQVKRQVWAEVHKAASNSLGIQIPRLNQIEIPMSQTNYAVGISTNDVTRFQGFHGKVLFVIDEATGVFPGLWEAIEGARASGDVRVLKLGNPTVAGGPFYRDFQAASRRVNRFTISAFDTPNFEGFTLDDLRDITDPNDPRLLSPYGNKYHYLVSRLWAWNVWDAEGEESNNFISRVLALFPPQSVYSLYSMTLLEQAQMAPWFDDDEEDLVAGLDVAGPGEDETCLTLRTRRTNRIVLCKSWSLPDPHDAILEALSPFGNRVKSLTVDEGGIGYHLIPRLRTALTRDNPFIQVINFNAGWQAHDPSRFVNRKAEAYWGFRDILPEVSGLYDPLMFEQAATIQYKHTPRNLIQIEDKLTYKKRTGMSPDRLESAILSFLEPQVNTFAGTPAGPPRAYQSDIVIPQGAGAVSLPNWARGPLRRGSR